MMLICSVCYTVEAARVHVKSNGESKADVFQHKFANYMPEISEVHRQLRSMTRERGGHLNAIDSSAIELHRLPENETRTSNLIPAIAAKIFSGAGAHSVSGDPNMDKDMATRLIWQDIFIGFICIILYVVTVIFGFCIVHRFSDNDLPIKYYSEVEDSEPVYSEADNIDDFLDSFNKAAGVRLVISGFTERTSRAPWRGKVYRTDFSVALDLEPWIAPGLIDSEDRQKLRMFLDTEDETQNLLLEKDVSWDGLDVLTRRIKNHLTRRGFYGIVDVRVASEGHAQIFQNNQWCNFLHNRTTRILCMLSGIGILFYWPYMWRIKKEKVLSRFHVNVDLEEYWSLIESRLVRSGFEFDPSLQTAMLEHVQ